MRVIQVGLGRFGQSWAELAQVAPGVDLVAVAEANPVAQTWAAAALNLPADAIHASLDAALAAHPADAVLVITPPETHLPLSIAALRAGCHVLVEKPLATTLADAETLIATARDTGRTVMVSQNYRFRRPPRTIQQLITSGTIGDLISVTVRCRRDLRFLAGSGNFRLVMGHPYTLDMSIHHFDLLRAITGREVSQVYAQHRRVPDGPYDHEPAIVALLKLDGGATVTYEGDWATFERETSWNGEWDIVGENGRIVWTGGETDSLTGDVHHQRWGEPLTPVDQVPLAAADRLGSLLAFRDALASGEEPEASAADNINSLAIVLACVESTEQGQIVHPHSTHLPTMAGTTA